MGRDELVRRAPSASPSTSRIPAIVNVESGSADAARAVLETGGQFDVHSVKPEDVAATVRDVVAAGANRIVVSGGDGTIATAATVLLETPAELAILPGGTLNHFARDLGVSTAPEEALDLAQHGEAVGVDVGTVNGQLFLNTSSVGAYVRFVRVRERLEPKFGYRIASAIAALRILLQLRMLAVEVEVDGQRRIYRSPLVFIGVGERELQLPTLGSRVANGKRGLHVMIVRSRTRAGVLAIALSAVARGVKALSRTPKLDSFLVDRCRITVRRPGLVAVDGELVLLNTTLDFTLRRDALRVVVPPAPVAGADQDASRDAADESGSAGAD